MVEKSVHRDAIFISQAADQTELFTAVFNQLNHLGYVKGNYDSDLQEREQQNSAPARTQLLARVVGLLRAVPPEELRVFLTAKSPEQIYAFLNKNLPD